MQHSWKFQCQLPSLPKGQSPNWGSHQRELGKDLVVYGIPICHIQSNLIVNRFSSEYIQCKLIFWNQPSMYFWMQKSVEQGYWQVEWVELCSKTVQPSWSSIVSLHSSFSSVKNTFNFIDHSHLKIVRKFTFAKFGGHVDQVFVKVWEFPKNKFVSCCLKWIGGRFQN